jgi:hypothetical protein
MSDRLTIVGPEPDDDVIAKKLDKVNIEALMLMAKYDDGFRRLLIDDRDRALAESGIKFSPMERMLLLKISAEKLSGNIEEFHVPGITRSSLANWRKAAAVILLVTSALFVAPNCQRFITKSVEEQGKQGWIDGDTYRLMAVGVFNSRMKDIEDKKTSAKRFAILNAQYQIAEKFKGMLIKGATGIIPDEEYRKELEKQNEKDLNDIKNSIKNGKIIKETYDAEQNCEILYEVRMKDLKRKVSKTYWD